MTGKQVGREKENGRQECVDFLNDKMSNLTALGKRSSNYYINRCHSTGVISRSMNTHRWLLLASNAMALAASGPNNRFISNSKYLLGSVGVIDFSLFLCMISFCFQNKNVAFFSLSSSLFILVCGRERKKHRVAAKTQQLRTLGVPECIPF